MLRWVWANYFLASQLTSAIGDIPLHSHQYLFSQARLCYPKIFRYVLTCFTFTPFNSHGCFHSIATNCFESKFHASDLTSRPPTRILRVTLAKYLRLYRRFWPHFSFRSIIRGSISDTILTQAGQRLSRTIVDESSAGFTTVTASATPVHH
jgi:hypothetical protein